MNLFGDLFPAENPYTDENGFEEEGAGCLDRQRRAEDIPDIAGIFRPVETELELHRNSGDNPESEVYQKQLAPEFGHAQPCLVSRCHILRLHPGRHYRQPERKRNENPMKHTGGRKLQLAERNYIHTSPLVKFYTAGVNPG